MRELVERTLGGWRAAPGQPAQPPPVPTSALPPPPPGCVFLVDRPGMTQVPPSLLQVPANLNLGRQPPLFQVLMQLSGAG